MRVPPGLAGPRFAAVLVGVSYCCDTCFGNEIPLSSSALQDIKRNGEFKARIVVRGDKENKEAVDGKDFLYYAVTANVTLIRAMLLQPGRHALKPGQTVADCLETAAIDVKAAFCQTNRFNDGISRFLTVKSPVDGVVRYYDQLSSLYGSCSAPGPVRWQNTFAEWAVTSVDQGGPGFVRGSNAPAAYYKSAHGDRARGAVLLVIYVDDILVTGKLICCGSLHC